MKTEWQLIAVFCDNTGDSKFIPYGNYRTEDLAWSAQPSAQAEMLAETGIPAGYLAMPWEVWPVRVKSTPPVTLPEATRLIFNLTDEDPEATSELRLFLGAGRVRRPYDDAEDTEDDELAEVAYEIFRDVASRESLIAGFVLFVRSASLAAKVTAACKSRNSAEAGMGTDDE